MTTPRDSVTIGKVVGLNNLDRNLKVMLSLGGWGGGEPCSEVFATTKAIREISESVLALNNIWN